MKGNPLSQELTIWHNPRCSKSRQTLQLLRDRGFEPVEVNYLKNPPSPEELKSVLEILGLSAKGLMRKSQDIYKELDLEAEQDEEALIEAMFHHPVLIERPVVLFKEKAAIGRPPETVLSIL